MQPSGTDNSDTDVDPPHGRASGGLEGVVVAGKYELVRLVGQGGMGAVYEARNLSTLKRCAVKLLLSPELAGHEPLVKRFFREAKASSVVESDHIVQVFDSGTDPQSNLPYMVMELLQGESLQALSHRVGAMEPNPAAKLVLQSAIGLARAHEMGIVHRDIKPANLFVTQRDSGDLVVKLLDFGIAKVKMENFAETSHGLTRTGHLLGTPLYMSPEQARGSASVDARADVWSLGVVLYELLSGHVPYSDITSLGDLMVAIITSDIPLVQDRAPWVPPELAEITHRAMSRDASKRYQNGGELRDALAVFFPAGPRVVPYEIVPVSPERRAEVAPRLELTDDGMLKAVTKSGVAVTQDRPLPKKPARGALAAVIVASLSLLGAVGLLIGVKVHRSSPKVTGEQLAVSAAHVGDQSGNKSFDLVIIPSDATVDVDGRPVTVKAQGLVSIEGLPGETRNVRVHTADGREKTLPIAITQTGLLPERIEVPAPAAPVVQSSEPPKTNPEKTAAKTPAGEKKPASKPETKPETKPDKPKPASGYDTSTDEFGK